MKKKPGFKNLKTRLVFTFLLTSLLPILFIFATIYFQRVRAIKEQAFSKLNAIKSLKVNDVNSWLDERVGDVMTLAGNREVRMIGDVLLNRRNYTEEESDRFENARELFVRYLTSYRAYDEIFFIDAITGKIVLSTNPRAEGENKFQDPYFTGPLQSGRIYFADIYYSRAIKKPAMSVSIPVYSL